MRECVQRFFRQFLQLPRWNRAFQELLAWHHEHGRKALLLTGARQVGKSTLIRKLGNEPYERFVEINLAFNDAAREALANSRDINDFLRRVSLFAQGPMPQGSTLVFIDEVQELPSVMTMAKALVEDGRYDYAFSGSMLGTEFKGARSYPVGFVQEMTLRPMDFEEFMWATGASEAAIAEVGDCKSGRNARAHAALNNLLATKEYALDLGMVFSRLNVERDGKVLYLPWYAVPFTGRAIGNDTHDTRGLRMTLPSL